MRIKTNIITNTIVTAAAVALAACGSSDGDSVDSADAAKARAVELVDGATASEAALVDDEGTQLWEVDVERDGAAIEVKIDKDSGELVELESEHPLTSDFTPVDGVISYNQARDIALGKQAGTVAKWEFKVEEHEHDGKAETHYEWEFYVRDDHEQLVEIVMDATNGEVSKVELKQAFD